MKLFLLTGLAIAFFAGNSILCRMALGAGLIDAASFTAIRLLSGAITLLALWRLSTPGQTKMPRPGWRGPVMLFVYALGFSYAYLLLDTGTGALILFAAVQVTILLVSWLGGNRLQPAQWLGTALAFAGFVYLVLPSLGSPSLAGFVLMTMAGIAWGFYTLAGQGSATPLADTMGNFVYTLPLALVLTLVALPQAWLSPQGVVLAILAGAITSGIGYAIWYMALAGLSGIQASVVQLLVPVLAALGGVLFMGEALTLRLAMSSVIMLAGILLVTLGKSRHQPS